ncbi:TIM barrel protein [Kitasatospora purpeofusca]|uniref:sugar phosphate isomerase/epimerase family protein n=1 Tax=Kitasatospora purpeofusca TaxID=67352 RepID=UPI002E13B0A3|nr:TIM barrel protein [Kitasatospora purpeofusca]
MTRRPARPVFTPAVDQATAGYTMPLEVLARAAGRAGLRTLEVPAFSVDAYLHLHGGAGLGALLAHTGVRIGQLSCGSGVPADLTVAAVQWTDAVAAWRRACRTALLAGCSRLSVFVPRGAQDLTLVAGRLSELAAVAGSMSPDLVVSVEIHSAVLLAQAARLVELVPAARLLVDVAALALVGLDPVAHVLALPAGSVGWVHLADLPGRPAPGERPERLLPGLGGLPLPAVLEGLRERGYRGPVAVEVPVPDADTGRVAAAGCCFSTGPLAGFFDLAE